MDSKISMLSVWYNVRHINLPTSWYMSKGWTVSLVCYLQCIRVWYTVRCTELYHCDDMIGQNTGRDKEQDILGLLWTFVGNPGHV